MAPLLKDAVDQAVDIAKVAAPMQAGSWISNPDAVSKFIEVVAKKIHDLKTNPSADTTKDVSLEFLGNDAKKCVKAWVNGWVNEWEEKINAVGDDAQLANIDLQNMLQKQQQTLQLMANISKLLEDTEMSVIRKIGG
jgi:phenolic acid decarboxylase